MSSQPEEPRYNGDDRPSNACARLAVPGPRGPGRRPRLRPARGARRWPDLNDNVLHYTLAARVVEAVDRGESPLDFWVSEWTLGYPVPRTYQPLGHLVVASLYLALGRVVPLTEVFLWIRFLLVCLLPLTAYATARLLMLGRAAALAAALLSPLTVTSGLYGLEYGSYLWRGSGLYAQAWAMHGLLLTLGFAYRAVRSGRGLVPAAATLALTFFSHFIYGYVAATSVLLLLLVRDRATLGRRLMRLAAIGLLALVLTAWIGAPVHGRRPHRPRPLGASVEGRLLWGERSREAALLGKPP